MVIIQTFGSMYIHLHLLLYALLHMFAHLHQSMIHTCHMHAVYGIYTCMHLNKSDRVRLRGYPLCNLPNGGSPIYILWVIHIE